MDKVKFFKHTINYHVAQVNLEADSTEEFGDWIDQPPPDYTRGYRPKPLHRRTTL